MSRMRDALEKLSSPPSADGAADAMPVLSFPSAQQPLDAPHEFAEFARQLTSPENPLDLPLGFDTAAEPAAARPSLFPQKPSAPPRSIFSQPQSATGIGFAPVSPESPVAEQPASGPAEPLLIAEQVDEFGADVSEKPPLDLSARGLAGRQNKRRTRQVDEAVTSIRHALKLQRAQVLLVGGAGPSAILADLTLRLAVGLSKGASGATLLVDADVGQRWLTVRLGMLKAPGWTDAIFQWLPWNGVFRPTTTPGLVICPIGAQLKSAANFAAASADKSLPWRNLAGAENTVIIFAGNTTGEPLDILAKACDACCLIVDIGQVSKRGVGQAHAALAKTGVPLVGCLVVG